MFTIPWNAAHVAVESVFTIPWNTHTTFVSAARTAGDLALYVQSPKDSFPYLQNFLIEDRPISSEEDHLRWVSAEPQATIMSDPRWRGQIGSVIPVVHRPAAGRRPGASRSRAKRTGERSERLWTHGDNRRRA